MGLDLESLANSMEQLLNDIIIEEKIHSLGNLKEDLATKNKIINKFIYGFNKRNNGKITKKLLDEFSQIEVDFNQLYENFDDKLMIFIIGNVGKSTLLNSLIGYEVAETNFLPNTWKIDVYSPETQNGKATIKYLGGKQESLSIGKVKDIIDNEEKKSKEGKKKYNENLNKELKGLRTKDEREEMKKYLGEKYLYKSNVAEVRWPVNKNWILEKCLLVDTPGLNQNLHDLEQLGNIHDYYHKADGVLWLLDGQTIAAANTNSLFNELNDILRNVGGVRDNIIGVINRMDLVRKNGGQEAVNKVLSDAKRIFGEKFYNIVDMSAQQAFDGVKNNNSAVIKESGILNLQNSIRDIFISKSESIKNSAKIQGHNKLVDITLDKLNEYSKEISKYENMYTEKNEKLQFLKDALKNNLEKDIDKFFKSYLGEVSKRVDIHINALSEGKGPDFIKNTMYKLDEFIKSRDKFIDNKQLEIKNSSYTWEKLCKISEYKYIQDNELVKNQNVVVNIKLNLSTLNDIAYFKPSVEEDLFSILGNILGKGMFWLRKGSIKNKINSAIREECNKMKEDIVKQLNNNIDITEKFCREIINITFKNILFDFKDIDSVREEIEILKMKMSEQKESIKLKEIIL